MGVFRGTGESPYFTAHCRAGIHFLVPVLRSDTRQELRQGKGGIPGRTDAQPAIPDFQADRSICRQGHLLGYGGGNPQSQAVAPLLDTRFHKLT